MEDFFEELKKRPQYLCKKCGKCCKSFNCTHLKEDNLCKVYENRSEVCKNFPCSPWQEVPEGCGFEGWLFLQREEKKQQIRKQKELSLSLEIMLKTAPPDETEKIKESIQKIKDFVELYSKYGSADW